MSLSLAEVMATLQDPVSCIGFLFIAAVVQGILFQFCVEKMKPVIGKQPWWPQAIPLQRQLLVNFGYDEQACDDAVCLWGYVIVSVFCCHHFLCGLMMLPALLLGWANAGLAGQSAFILALLSDASLNIFDEFQMMARLFFPKSFEWLGPKQSKKFFVIIGCLHHPLAICMGVPMTWWYASMPAFHETAVALLFAASICFLGGSYKFTLDTRTKAGFLQYKAIVLAQLVTIYWSRGYVWSTRLYTVLMTFYSNGDTAFFFGGCLCGVLMTLFNVVLILDATQAAVKWLPRSMPKLKEQPDEGSKTTSEKEAAIANDDAALSQVRARANFEGIREEMSAFLER